jgi:hypothetical protein
MLLHLGCVQFRVTGPARYTMTASQAVERCSLAQPHTTIPVHYEGWNHFREGRDNVQTAVAMARPLRNRTRMHEVWASPIRAAAVRTESVGSHQSTGRIYPPTGCCHPARMLVFRRRSRAISVPIRLDLFESEFRSAMLGSGR